VDNKIKQIRKFVRNGILMGFWSSKDWANFSLEITVFQQLMFTSKAILQFPSLGYYHYLRFWTPIPITRPPRKTPQQIKKNTIFILIPIRRWKNSK
jgi:hypothetical protein